MPTWLVSESVVKRIASHEGEKNTKRLNRAAIKTRMDSTSTFQPLKVSIFKRVGV